MDADPIAAKERKERKRIALRLGLGAEKFPSAEGSGVACEVSSHSQHRSRILFRLSGSPFVCQKNWPSWSEIFFVTTATKFFTGDW